MTSRPLMSPPLRLSFEQDDADGIAVDHSNHAIVRGNARHVLLRLDDDPLPGFLLHGRIAGLGEDLSLFSCRPRQPPRTLRHRVHRSSTGEIAKHGIHRRSSLSELRCSASVTSAAEPSDPIYQPK
jgi:hypothetical protein